MKNPLLQAPTQLKLRPLRASRPAHYFAKTRPFGAQTLAKWPFTFRRMLFQRTPQSLLRIPGGGKSLIFFTSLNTYQYCIMKVTQYSSVRKNHMEKIIQTKVPEHLLKQADILIQQGWIAILTLKINTIQNGVNFDHHWISA